VLALVVAVFLGRPALCEAQLYRWVDSEGVAHFSEGIDSIPEKFRGTATPLGLRNAPPAPAGQAPADAAGASGVTRTGGTQIKFTPGRPIIVEALINGRTTTRLVLDTGADRTVVNPRALAAAGVSLRQSANGRIRGATGTAPVQAAYVDSLEVGRARVGKLLVISHDIEQDGVDGLLGRDFLGQFTVSIDSKAGIATLDPK